MTLHVAAVNTFYNFLQRSKHKFLLHFCYILSRWYISGQINVQEFEIAAVALYSGQRAKMAGTETPTFHLPLHCGADIMVLLLLIWINSVKTATETER